MSSSPYHDDDIAVLAAVGRLYLDCLDEDPANEYLSLPDAMAVSMVREAVERWESRSSVDDLRESPPIARPRRRLRGCVERWPGALIEGDYHPSCCRFPKSCSADVYDDEHVTDGDLEPVERTGEEAAGA